VNGTFPWERLSAADASNLILERPGQAYTIGLVGLLESGPLLTRQGEPDVDRIRHLLAPRVATVPGLCRRLHPTRWGQGLPVWVDCPPDLAVHVQRGPRLESRADLDDVCGRLLAQPLPRDRPLWDLLILPGPGRERVTILVRLHHAVADGIRALDIVGTLFDPPAGTTRRDGGGEPAPTPALIAAPPTRRPPTGRELVADALLGRLARTASVRHVRRWPARGRALLRGLARTIAIARGGLPRTSLLGPVGSRRAVAFASADLGPIRARAHASDATVNDVLLAAVADAARCLLEARGEHLRRDLPVSVPVSLDPPGAAADRGGNRVGVMVARIPPDEADPERRLRRIAAATDRDKKMARDAGALELTRSRWATRVMDRISRHQRTVALFVTNVPGPRERLRLGGAAMVQAWPLSLIAGNVRVAVAALSYADRLAVTVTADADSTPDSDLFITTLARALGGEGPEDGEHL
jgi:WS/DGAT/MGAT family acyltransferase